MKKSLFKVMILGDSGVGKTSLLEQYVNQVFTGFYKVTIGSDFLPKDLIIGDNKIKLQLWDTAGQEKYQSVCAAFYRGADACVLVYDVTDKHSFKNLGSWIDNFTQQMPAGKVKGFPMVLVGNKVDKKKRFIGTDEARTWCAAHDEMPYFETSAKTRQGVDEAFLAVANLVIKRSEEDEYIRICVTMLVCSSSSDIKGKKVTASLKQKKEGCC